MEISVIIIGLLLLTNGVIILKNKKYGPEEGTRGNYFKGNFARAVGIFLTLVGIFVLLAGLINIVLT